MEDCIFCKMANGEVPSHKIYEDEDIFAFLDNFPIEKGHILVIPKEHYENIFDVPEDLIKDMYGVAQKITKTISKTFKVEDFNILQNNGTKAGQSVFHYHIHIIPRYDEFKLCLGNGPILSDEEVRNRKEDLCLSNIAKLIREKL
ncbi:HIT family protein [bacterium]|nr:HIT family protein [bacterium]